jgi:hypothetical protein
MLVTVPKSLWAWDFDVLDSGGLPVGEVRLGSWRERGSVTAAGVAYEIERQRGFGAFIMTKEGVEVGRAVKPSALFRSFEIEHEGRLLTLKAWSSMRRAMALWEGGTTIGTIAPDGILTRRARIKLPDELPLALDLFLVWLTMLLWKRGADSETPGLGGDPGSTSGLGAG